MFLTQTTQQRQTIKKRLRIRQQILISTLVSFNNCEMTTKDLKSVKVNFNLRTDGETSKDTPVNTVIRWNKQ